MKLLVTINLIRRGPLIIHCDDIPPPLTIKSKGPYVKFDRHASPQRICLQAVLMERRKRIVRTKLLRTLFFGKKGRKKELSSHGVRIACRA